MTKEGWRDVVLMAVRNDAKGDPDMLNHLAELLAQQDKAKSRLADVYGCTGMSWAELVDSAVERPR